ncbi:MAG: hypothetical protein AAF587_14160 [Bacteroidota bacterium]
MKKQRFYSPASGVINPEVIKKVHRSGLLSGQQDIGGGTSDSPFGKIAYSGTRSFILVR